MLSEITQDILWPGLIAMVAMVIWGYSINMGYLPPLSGTAALQLEFAKWSAVGPDMMFDENKD